jgi:hypothetical protein
MLMDVAIKRGGTDAGFAVIRNYAPARIERELLAQVFDLVQQGESLRVAGAGHAESVVDSSSTTAINDDSAATFQDHLRDDQRAAREAAA